MPNVIDIPYDPNETTFEEDIPIDKYNLDVECERQAIKYEKWSRKWAIANTRMEQLKAVRELVEARLDSEIRADPESFNIAGRVTEQAIKVVIRQHEEYQQASDQYNEAVLLANTMVGAKWAMEQRRDMISDLVKLYGSQYFARPTITQQVVEEVTTQRTQAQIDYLQKRAKIRKPITVES